MKNTILLLLIVFFGVQNMSFTTLPVGDEGPWKTLEKVTFKKKFDETLGLYVDQPVFSKEIKTLNKKEITIKGYIIPLEGYQEQNYFVFSKFPYNMCFFCGGAGPETVMEVETKKGKEIKYTSKLITIKGKLKLNGDNVDRLMYILEDAQLVK